MSLNLPPRPWSFKWRAGMLVLRDAGGETINDWDTFVMLTAAPQMLEALEAVWAARGDDPTEVELLASAAIATANA